MTTTGHPWWLPQDISTHGAPVDNLINWIHWFMIVLFVGWGIFFVYCLIRFRQKPGHQASYELIKAKPSKYAEVFVVIIEAVLLIGVSIPVWASVKTEFPKPEEDPMEIHVIAQQFAWNIHYPGDDGKFGPRDVKLIDETENPIGLDRSHPDGKDDITTINLLHVPVDRPIIVRLTSKDVIHSFWLPMVRLKQDAIPGMEIPVWFEVTETSKTIRENMKRAVALPDEGTPAEQFVKQARLGNKIPMQDYTAKDGSVILAQGSFLSLLSDDKVSQLRQAGINEITVAPSEPMEIHCAQLCGLNHYSMRGFFTVETQEEFDQWMEQQKAFLPVEDDWGFEDDDWGEEDED